MVNRLVTSLFLVIFSMLLLHSIQEGDTVFIIINALFVLIDIISLTFRND